MDPTTVGGKNESEKDENARNEKNEREEEGGLATRKR